MSATPHTEPPHAETPAVQHLRVECRSGMAMMLVLCGLIGGAFAVLANLCLLVFGFKPNFQGIEAGIGVLVSFEICGWIWHRRAMRRLTMVRAELARDTAENVPAMVADALESSNKYAMMLAPLRALSGRSAADEAAAILCDHGHTGTVFRMSEDATPGAAEFEPITVPFEPAPLGPKAPDMNSAADTSGQQSVWRQTWEQISRQHGRSRFARVISGITTLLLLALIGWTLIDMLQQLTAGKVPDVVDLIPLMAALVGMTLLVKLISPRQWLAVPGALVVRTSTWRSANWQLHMLRREESVLIYWVEANMLAVAAGEGVQFTRRVSPAVAEFAIRAWLSPLEPPPEERLSDLL